MKQLKMLQQQAPPPQTAEMQRAVKMRLTAQKSEKGSKRQSV